MANQGCAPNNIKSRLTAVELPVYYNPKTKEKKYNHFRCRSSAHGFFFGGTKAVETAQGSVDSLKENGLFRLVVAWHASGRSYVTIYIQHEADPRPQPQYFHCLKHSMKRLRYLSPGSEPLLPFSASERHAPYFPEYPLHSDPKFPILTLTFIYK